MKSTGSEKSERGVVLDALAIEVRRIADMPDFLRARVLANRPSLDEIAAGRWITSD